MEYIEEVLDRQTGTLVETSLGNWITISEMASKLGVGKRQIRAILLTLGFLFVAIGSERNRTQLSGWVIDRKWGRRILRRRGYPFDVINEDAQRWIEERWEAAAAQHNDLADDAQRAKLHLGKFISERSDPESMNAKMQVKWLIDHYPTLTHTEISKIISVTQQRVSVLIKSFEVQMKEKMRLRMMIGVNSPPA